MSDMGTFSPEATRQTPAATVERAGYINKYGSRVVVAPEIALERNIRGTYQEIEDEVDRLTRIRDQLERETSQAGIVGSELGYNYVRLNAGLEYLVDQLNDQGASIGGKQVTVAGLIAPDARIRVKNTRIGNFRIEGIRTFSGGQDLLEEVSLQDNALYLTAIGNSDIDIDGLPTAFEALNSSIEARPETEAAAKEASQEIEELNAEIDRLQADADVLRASISEVDTKGKQPDPATPAAQMNILEGVLQRNITDNRFDFRMRTNRLRETQERLAPAVEAVSGYESPEVQTARRLGATPSAGRAPVAPPAAAPSAVPPAARPSGMPGDGAPEWVTRMTQGRGPATGELTSQGYFGPGGHGMGDMVRAPETTGQSKEEQFAALRELGISPDVAYQAVYGSPSSDGGGQPARPSAAEIEAANREEVEAFLRGQFGGFEFFLNKHDAELHVGLTSDGLIVDADDPSAVTTKNVLDVIVEQGLTDPGRIEGALGHTEWWQTTDAQARVFDVTYENLNELERLEYVEPTMDLIREELQFLGAEMSDAERQQLAADLMRLGDQGDQETVRDMIIDRLKSFDRAFDPAASSLSDFAAARDEIEEMSRRYFVPIDTATAGQWAQDIYLGDRTSTQIEQYFKEHAVSKFPTLENAIKGGFTPEEYFAPYKYEIERMLGRPNINLYDEFADVIEYFPDTGGDQPRPMTMHEVRKYVRGLPEWQQSYQGQQSAEALAFAIGKTFGEVA